MSTFLHVLGFALLICGMRMLLRIQPLGYLEPHYPGPNPYLYDFYSDLIAGLAYVGRIGYLVSSVIAVWGGLTLLIFVP